MHMLHGRTHAVFLLLSCSLENDYVIYHWERAVIGYMHMLHCARTHAVFLMLCALCNFLLCLWSSHLSLRKGIHWLYAHVTWVYSCGISFAFVSPWQWRCHLSLGEGSHWLYAHVTWAYSCGISFAFVSPWQWRRHLSLGEGSRRIYAHVALCSHSCGISDALRALCNFLVCLWSCHLYLRIDSHWSYTQLAWAHSCGISFTFTFPCWEKQSSDTCACWIVLELMRYFCSISALALCNSGYARAEKFWWIVGSMGLGTGPLIYLKKVTAWRGLDYHNQLFQKENFRNAKHSLDLFSLLLFWGGVGPRYLRCGAVNELECGYVRRDHSRWKFWGVWGSTDARLAYPGRKLTHEPWAVEVKRFPWGPRRIMGVWIHPRKYYQWGGSAWSGRAFTCMKIDCLWQHVS
jgi:hypothetical protein